MRKLVVLRGISGCGKSTFIKEHHLEAYTLCPDTLRLLYTSPMLDEFGHYQISQEKNTKVFSLLYELLDTRMAEGEFTVIDSTNLTKDDFVKYKKLAKKYRYQIYCIDFTDVPFQTILKQNKMREELKVVPDEVLYRMKDRLAQSETPTGVVMLKPQEFDKVLMSPIDLSKYKKIHHFGDIHGCYSVLKEYFDKIGGLKEDEYYIFCGDYTDRGIQNAEVLKFLISIMGKSNVQFIQGNHEIHLFKYIHGEKANSTEFNEITSVEFETKGLTKKEISMFCKKLTQCAYYTYHGKTVIATHGGLSTIPNNLAFVSTKQMIKGVGKYSQYMDVVKSFYETTDKQTYQVNGHRNLNGLPIEVMVNGHTSRNFNLEGGVEHGGCLRVLTLDETGFVPIEIKNHIFKPETKKTLLKLRHNDLIKEKKFEEISSFNFIRDAFTKGAWNDQTIKARGLYLNNETGDVICRGYEKFFAIDERPESSIGTIKNTYAFPLTAYVKENGFLGLASYREKTDELFMTTKSDPTGDYARLFVDLLKTYDTEKMKEYTKVNNCTFVFEVIDIEHDPHIIKYQTSKLVLLDVVENNIEEFKRKDYKTLCEIADAFGFEVKKKAITLHNFTEFINWYKDISKNNYKYNGEYIEGFVLEDMKNRMCKFKTQYYKCWKYLRGKVGSINSHNFTFDQVKCPSSMIQASQMNDFLHWYCKNRVHITTDRIVELREMYEGKE